MTMETVGFLLIGAFCGGFINGLAGTGTALFALGFFLNALDPLRAVALVALISTVSGTQGLWLVRDAIGQNIPRLLRFVLPGLVGVPFGILLLKVIDADTLKLVIATLLIIYGGYFGFRRSLPKYDTRTPKTDALIGLVGGVMGGAASLSGALPAIWCTIHPWSKSETRAVLQPFNVAILSTTVTLLLFQGAYDQTTLYAAAIAMPMAFVAVQIGIAVFKAISDDHFRRLVIILCLLLGIGIFIQTLV